MTLTPTDAPAFLRTLFDHAVAAAHPMNCFPDDLPPPPIGRTIVLGAGKAAASMARAFVDRWAHPCMGLVICRYGHSVEVDGIEVIEAGHPNPDATGISATQKILQLAASATINDLVIVLMSGGASSLLVAPAEGVALADKRQVITDLMKSGASISELNAIRTTLSKIKGGGLARACGAAPTWTYIISDVPGDDPQIVGSGPTIERQVSRNTIDVIMNRYHIRPPPEVIQFWNTTVASQDQISREVTQHSPDNIIIIANAMTSLLAAKSLAEKSGILTLIIGDRFEGQSVALGRTMAEMATSIITSGHPCPPPCLLLSGGETVTRISASAPAGACGGPNHEFLLGMLTSLRPGDPVYALSADTDGIDGSAPLAGGIITPSSLARAMKSGLTPEQALTNSDSYGFFKTLDDTVGDGPTRTNVNDFRAVLIQP